MARFKADEVDNYGGQGGGGFFSIPNDKQVKQVRFMYRTPDDIDGISVHKIKIGDKDRYVNCLREYKDPMDVCPFCREHMNTQARVFIPVYNIEEDAVQIWDRGKTMFQKLVSQCTRYSKDCDVVSNIFEVERNGKPKDQKTSYELYQVDCDDTTLEDLPELPKILGGLVMDKTAEDMEYYLQEGEFPPEDEEEEAPVRRRSGRDEDRSSRRESRDTGRRTPASNTRSRRNEDTF